MPHDCGPQVSSGTNSGTISASNMLPPQVGHDVHAAVGQRALEDADAQVGLPLADRLRSVQDQSQLSSGNVR